MLAIVLVLVVLFVTDTFNFIAYRTNNLDKQLALQKLWEEGDFIEILRVTEEGLTEAPLHPNYLLYNGLSHYYIANSSTDTASQTEHIEHSIRRLRKLLLLEQPPQLSNVYLTLGRGYYHKGPLYYPEAIAYIENALLLGAENDEVYQYLGASYAHLGDYEKSIEYLQRAARASNSVPIKFALAKIYVISGQVENAQELYAELSGNGELSQRQAQRLWLLEIEILVARQEYAQAKGSVERLIDEYPNIADAYFQLGEIHFYMNELDRARYNWRTALKTDSNHTGALHRLQE